jgi:hypothetical protein
MKSRSPSDFQFVPDLINLEIGWMFFKAGQAPDLRMVKLGEVMADRPPGADAEGKPLFKQGVRLLMKLGKTCGGDLRELAATAKSILGPDRQAARRVPGRRPRTTRASCRSSR